MGAEENQKQVSLRAHSAWKSRRDFHIPTSPARPRKSGKPKPGFPLSLSTALVISNPTRKETLAAGRVAPPSRRNRGCKYAMGESPLHCHSLRRAGQFQPESSRQSPPMLGGLADAAFADHGSGQPGKRHVDQRNLQEGFEALPRLVAQSRLAATRRQALPERIDREPELKSKAISSRRLRRGTRREYGSSQAGRQARHVYSRMRRRVPQKVAGCRANPASAVQVAPRFF
jgi:hypothetical protein